MRHGKIARQSLPATRASTLSQNANRRGSAVAGRWARIRDRDGKLVTEAMDLRTEGQFIKMLAQAGLQ
jgi:hypothetical protein